MSTITDIKRKISELSPAGFQELCDAYLCKTGYPNIVSLGTFSGAEKTTPGTPDTYFSLNNKYVFVEYTTQNEGLVTKIESDIKKCLDSKITEIPVSDISEIIYCHTSSNIAPKDDKRLKELCSNVGINLIIIGIDLISNDLLYKYPILIKNHLGISVDTAQIQSVEDFIIQYNENKLAAPLDTIFQFREKELSELDSAFNNVNVVVLSGSAGTGKTRLALAYAENRKRLYNERTYCIHNRNLPIWEDIRSHFEHPGKYFLIIDDANQLSNLELIVEYANKSSQGFDVKIILTVRDYAAEKVKTDIMKSVNYQSVNIEVFSNEEIKSIVKESLGILNSHYLDRIAEISEGNARIAILTGKIAVKENSLASIHNVSTLFSEYFADTLTTTGLDTNNKMLLTAGVMALFEALHLDKLDSIIPYLTKIGLTKNDFVSELYKLHDVEVVDIYRDKAVKFSEQCFSNFILKYVFFDKKILSLADTIDFGFKAFKTKIIVAINTLNSIFRDHELYTFIEGEIKIVWDKLKDTNSTDFIEFVKSFHIVNPTETLILLKKEISLIDPVFVDINSFDSKQKKNNNEVKDDIISILGSLSNLYDSSVSLCALDLFFEYYIKRPDLYIQFYHAANIYMGIKLDSFENDHQTTIQYLEKIIEFSERTKNEWFDLLFIETAETFLNFKFSPHESVKKGNSIIIHHLYISKTNGTSYYRNLIWNHLIVLYSSGKYQSIIKHIVKRYAHNTGKDSEKIIRDEAELIGKLIINNFSPECLEDCVAVDSLISVYNHFNISTVEFDAFINNSKFTTYCLLMPPPFDSEISYDQLEKNKEKEIADYILNNPLENTKCLCSIASEAMQIADINDFYIKRNLNIAIETISKFKEVFIQIINHALSLKYTHLLKPSVVIEILFKFLSADETYGIINRIDDGYLINEWKYTFFTVISEEQINHYWYSMMMDFLTDTSDMYFEPSYCRDITFTDKYVKINANVFIETVQLVFSKRSYSDYAAYIYLDLLFNKYNIPSIQLVERFANHLDLLEDIYLWLSEYRHTCDMFGEVLFEIVKKDRFFLERYINMLLLSTRRERRELNEKLHILYKLDNYIDCMDEVMGLAMQAYKENNYCYNDIVECIVTLKSNDPSTNAKIIEWIRHYITCNISNEDELNVIFEATSEHSVENRADYFNTFVKNNSDFKLFASLPLIPRSYGWSGSPIPLYSSWIDMMNKILPNLTGIEYLEHKQHIKKEIETVNKYIENAEIVKILES